MSSYEHKEHPGRKENVFGFFFNGNGIEHIFRRQSVNRTPGNSDDSDISYFLSIQISHVIISQRIIVIYREKSEMKY